MLSVTNHKAKSIHSLPRSRSHIKTDSSQFGFLKSAFVMALSLFDPRSLVTATNISQSGTWSSSASKICHKTPNILLQQCSINPPINPCKNTHFLHETNSPEKDFANLIAIGERHSDKRASAECIEHLTKTGKPQIILVETYPAGMIVPCSVKKIRVKPNRTCIGWDTIEYGDNYILSDRKNEILNAFRDQIQKIYQSLPNLEKIQNELDNSLNKIIHETNKLKKVITENKPITSEFDEILQLIGIDIKNERKDILFTIRVFNLVHQSIKRLRNEKKSYSYISKMDSLKLPLESDDSGCYLEDNTDNCKKIAQLEARRNRSLIKSLRKYYHNNGQLFIVAGAAHLNPKIGLHSNRKFFTPVIESVEEVRRTIRSLHTTNPYQVLSIISED